MNWLLYNVHVTSNCFKGMWNENYAAPRAMNPTITDTLNSILDSDLIKLCSINNWPTFISHNYSHHLIVLCQWSLTDPSGSLDGFDGTFQPLLRMRSLPLLQFQVRRAAQHCWRRQKIMACIDATKNRQGNPLLCFDV